MNTNIISSPRNRNPAPGLPVRATKRLSEAQKARFIEALAATGIMAEAARQASPHTQTGGLRTYKRAIESDPIFAAQVSESISRAHGAIVLEARRRALSGDLVPVLQKGEQAIMADGSPAFIRRYSDSLLLRLLNHVPGFEPTQRVEHEHSGTVRHENAMVIDLDQLVLLDQGDRDALRRIMTKLAHADQKQIAGPVIETDYEDVTASPEVQPPEDWEVS